MAASVGLIRVCVCVCVYVNESGLLSEGFTTLNLILDLVCVYVSVQLSEVSFSPDLF